jgi:hypothetical protein
MPTPNKYLGKGTIVNAAGVIVYVQQLTPFSRSRPVIESEEINPPNAYPSPELGDQEVSECEIMYYYTVGVDPLETAFDSNAIVTATFTLPATLPDTPLVIGPISCKVRSVQFEPITKKNWIAKKAILTRIA